MGSPQFYRPEIDGLRAIAVLPVMLFHGQVVGFEGGYIGVDVFFVISGYLITSLLHREYMQTAGVSLTAFYQRRMRRILPALFLMMLVCCALAWIFLLPSELKYFAKSAMFVAGFSSNILFSNKTGYFDPISEDIPLLHTWSLAVEEQFYLAFPILFIAIMKLGIGQARIMLVVLTSASLLVAEITLQYSPSQAFYLLPSRFWELCCGSCLALSPRVSNLCFFWRQGMSLVGLALIFLSISLFNEQTPHPSLVTIVPVLGVLMIIAFAKQDTLVGASLSSQLLVSIGLVSYSAYLWHQPLFVFYRIEFDPQIPFYISFVIIAASFALAYLTWRFVETPFRNVKTISSQLFFAILAVSVLAVLWFEWTVREGKGFPERNPMMQTVEHVLRPNQGLGVRCDYKGPFTPLAECTNGTNTPSILLWGDSMAAQLASAIISIDPTAKLIQATKSSCAPIADYTLLNSRTSIDQARDCIEFNKAVFDYLKSSEIQSVVISLSVQSYIDAKNTVLHNNRVTDASFAGALDAVRGTLTALKSAGKAVILVTPPPSIGTNPALCLSKAALRNRRVEGCDFSFASFQHKHANSLALFSIIEGSGFDVERLQNYICDTKHCSASRDGVWIYRDGVHLSYDGSKWIGPQAHLLRRFVYDAQVNASGP